MRRGQTALVFGLGFIAGVVSLSIWLAATNRFSPAAHASVQPANVPPVIAPRAAPAEPAKPPVLMPQPQTSLPTPPPLNPSAATSAVIPGANIPNAQDTGPLEGRNLGLPIAGLKRSDIQDTFNDARGGGGRRHEAADILAPRGTPVVALDQGNVAKLFTSKQGGLTVYQFDDAQEYAYYYAHLDRYAPGLREGMLLRKGDLVGYVGSTGDANAGTPHLHLAIFRLGPEKRWWKGTPINPYSLLISAFERQSRN